MTDSKPASRSLVGVAFEAYVKAQQAKKRAASAEAELRTWTRRLNATETEEYEAQVAEYTRENSEGK